jgi:hypothetical protein
MAHGDAAPAVDFRAFQAALLGWLGGSAGPADPT